MVLPEIHLFSVGPFSFLLEVETGSLHLLDQVAYAVARGLTNGKTRPDVVTELSPLFGRRAVEEALEELEELFATAPGGSWPEIEIKERRPPKALCLLVSHDCNLRCRYCFTRCGTFGGEERGLMSWAVAKRAVDFLASSTRSRTVEIDFFGGEPLLNFEVVGKTVAYAREKFSDLGKEVRFTLTTNGVLLNSKVIEFLNRENIQVILSLDGRPEVNDGVRRFPSGRGTYHYVLPRFQELAATRSGNYYLRGTFTARNTDFAEDALHLYRLGFSFVSLEPVVPPVDTDLELKEEHLPELRAEYERLALAILKEEKEKGRQLEFFHFRVGLEPRICLPRLISGCGAGNEYLAVTWKGEIYPCHQLVGYREFLMGDVFQGMNGALVGEEFARANILTKNVCRRCWARYFCGGGCLATSVIVNGSLYEPYRLACELQKLRLEVALFLEAARQGNIFTNS